MEIKLSSFEQTRNANSCKFVQHPNHTLPSYYLVCDGLSLLVSNADFDAAWSIPSPNGHPTDSSHHDDHSKDDVTGVHHDLAGSRKGRLSVKLIGLANATGQ